MRTLTEQQIIKKYESLINKEIKKSRLYGEINRYRRIIEIVKGINPIEKQRALKSK